MQYVCLARVRPLSRSRGLIPRAGEKEQRLVGLAGIPSRGSRTGPGPRQRPLPPGAVLAVCRPQAPPSFVYMYSITRDTATGMPELRAWAHIEPVVVGDMMPTVLGLRVVLLGSRLVHLAVVQGSCHPRVWLPTAKCAESVRVGVASYTLFQAAVTRHEPRRSTSMTVDRWCPFSSRVSSAQVASTQDNHIYKNRRKENRSHLKAFAVDQPTVVAAFCVDRISRL